ncbi:uncharacterized protein LOC143288363 isoform X3 [Babylonia areolata]|uniref:uncharacterized protein LOC143288363 isoform X3 n=1 Tax=Babylonia areolata TaxID=304850 RepID=UPI003FD106FA
MDSGFAEHQRNRDALLADLQSTTQHISSYQQYQQQQQQQQQQQHPPPQHHQHPPSSPYSPQPPPSHGGGGGDGSGGGVAAAAYSHQHTAYGYNSSGGGGVGQAPRTVVRKSDSSSTSSQESRGSTPPLPPPPAQELLESIPSYNRYVEPIYEQQTFQVREATPSSDSSESRQAGGAGGGERMSALSNNLSELDQLLQDLNSAQFLADVDRKSQVGRDTSGGGGGGGGLVNGVAVSNTNSSSSSINATANNGGVNVGVVVGGGVGKTAAPPPPVAPKPTKPSERATVESLLDELESAVPPAGNRAPAGPGGFQEVGGGGTTTTTSHVSSSSSYHHQQQHHQQHHHHQQQQHQQQHQANFAAVTDGAPPLPPASHHHHLPPLSHQGQQATAVHSHQHQVPQQAASSATKELDELMASLSEFKQQAQTSNTATDPSLWTQTEPAYAKPVKSRSVSSQSPTSPVGPSGGAMPPGSGAGGQGHNAASLDSMLGDLQSDMNRQGVNTKKKGVCAACNKPIVGQVIAALGRTWHVEHFVCAHCEQPLGTSNFYERDGVAYCEVDYHNLFAPRCAYCNGPIVDKCITALEKMWHPEHFFCAQCGRQFGDEDFHEKNGKAYCRDDYFQMFAPKCGGCGMPIMENYISALNRQWHPQCFCCWECQAPFGTGSFYDHDGLPYCETHYHAKKGSLCASCQKPITGRCITAMFKKFHPEHFVCAFCLKQLNKGTFKEQNDKPYCHPCFVKLFG